MKIKNVLKATALFTLLSVGQLNAQNDNAADKPDFFDQMSAVFKGHADPETNKVNIVKFVNDAIKNYKDSGVDLTPNSDEYDADILAAHAENMGEIAFFKEVLRGAGIGADEQKEIIKDGFVDQKDFEKILTSLYSLKMTPKEEAEISSFMKLTIAN